MHQVERPSNVQTLRRTPEVQFLRHGDEITQLPQLKQKVHSCGY